MEGFGRKSRTARDMTHDSHRMKLLLRHRESLYAYILACVRSHLDADDIVQTVSLTVIDADDVPAEDDRFLAWAREVARRRVLEHVRKSKRLLPIDPEVAQRLAEAAERVERKRPTTAHREALLECLEKLPPESQQLLAARYDGTSADVAALAKRFGRSVQGAYSLLYRIRKILRECIERRLGLEAVR
jgi:RNA polymerase sigma-70 factor (ECF subfamily)